MKKKMDLVIGQKYRGYGWINEYGEMMFTPEEKGKHAGRIKSIKEGDNYTLSSSKNKVIVHITLPHLTGLKLIQELMKCVNELIQDFRTYEI